MSAHRLVATLTAFSIWFGVGGCLGVRTTSGFSTAAEPRSLSPVFGDELDLVKGLTIYDAILRLRPAYVRTRARTQPAVYLDNMPIGGLNELRGMSVWEVREIRYVAPRDAMTRFGRSAGVILIFTGARGS